MNAAALSARIYELWAGNPAAGFVSPLTPAATAIISAQCDAIAQAVIEHIQANATVTIKTTDAALQIDADTSHATLGPAENKTLPGGCIG